eukprot:gene19369-25236_t
MSDNVDADLLDIINKLNKIQKEIGGAKAKEAIVGEDGKIDRFLDLRNQMFNRLSNIKDTLELVHRLEKSPGSNPKELISAQSKVRTELTAINEDWKELDTLYRNEAKKKRSKLSPEEMKSRQQMIVKLQLEIQGIKEIQRAGYVKGYQAIVHSTMEDSELFKPKEFTSTDDPNNTVNGTNPLSRGVGPRRGEELTDDHRLQLQKIKERDVQFDKDIEEIGKGVDELREMALAAKEEVTLQNRMLDTLGTKIEDVHEHVVNINEKLKVTLEEVRNSDKICMPNALPTELAKLDGQYRSTTGSNLVEFLADLSVPETCNSRMLYRLS